MDHEAEACSGNGFYFESSAGSFRLADLRFAWIGVMAGIAGLAALLLLGWSEIEAGPVGATEARADPSPSPAAAVQVEAQADGMEEIRRRGLELLRADFPEDAPSPSLTRGDRLELHDANIKPVVRIATAGEDEPSVAPSAALPAPPAASKAAETKQKHAVEERPAHRRHVRRASRQHRDRVRMAHAKYVQAPVEPQVALGTGLQQPNRAPAEDNNVFGWMVPSSWKGGWENLWAKGSRE